MGNGLLDALYRSASSWEERRDRDRLVMLETVMEDLKNFPMVLLEYEELPVHRVSPLQRVRLFPLGECRYVELDELKGRTSLYMGSDGRLYEYGPRRVWSLGDEKDPLADERITLRVLDVNKLDYFFLYSCRDLLRRVWLI